MQRLISEVASTLGLDIRIENIAYTLEKVKFCQHTLSEWGMIPDPVRAYVKLSAAVVGTDSPAARALALRNKLSGVSQYLAKFPDMPLLRVLAPLTPLARDHWEGRNIAERYDADASYPDWITLFPEYDFEHLEAHIRQTALGSDCLCPTILSPSRATLDRPPFVARSTPLPSSQNRNLGSFRILILSTMVSSLSLLHQPSRNWTLWCRYAALASHSVLACQQTLTTMSAIFRSSFPRSSSPPTSAPSQQTTLRHMVVLRTLNTVVSWLQTILTGSPTFLTTPVMPPSRLQLMLLGA